MLSQTANLLNYPATAPLWFNRVTILPAQFEKKNLLQHSGGFFLFFSCSIPLYLSRANLSVIQWHSQKVIGKKRSERHTDIPRKLQAKKRYESSLLAEILFKKHGSSTEIGQEFKFECNFKGEPVDLEIELSLLRYLLTLQYAVEKWFSKPDGVHWVVF